MDSITLTLDAKTLDYIANVLGQRPYTEVATVLNTIATQVQQQRSGPVVAHSGGNGVEAPSALPTQ